MATCRACAQEIHWARTQAGKVMPLDGDGNGGLRIVEDGNVAVRPSGGWQLSARVLTAGDKPDPDEHRTVAHFATCPEWGR